MDKDDVSVGATTEREPTRLASASADCWYVGEDSFLGLVVCHPISLALSLSFLSRCSGSSTDIDMVASKCRSHTDEAYATSYVGQRSCLATESGALGRCFAFAAIVAHLQVGCPSSSERDTVMFGQQTD